MVNPTLLVNATHSLLPPVSSGSLDEAVNRAVRHVSRHPQEVAGLDASSITLLRAATRRGASARTLSAALLAATRHISRGSPSGYVRLIEERWRLAVLTGRVARDLAFLTGSHAVLEQAALAGLLHNVGEVALLTSLAADPSVPAAALRSADALAAPLAVHHEALGAEVLLHSGHCEALVAVAAHHHGADPLRAPVAVANLRRVVQAACWIADDVSAPTLRLCGADGARTRALAALEVPPRSLARVTFSARQWTTSGA